MTFVGHGDGESSVDMSSGGGGDLRQQMSLESLASVPRASWEDVSEDEASCRSSAPDSLCAAETVERVPCNDTLTTSPAYSLFVSLCQESAATDGSLPSPPFVALQTDALPPPVDDRRGGDLFFSVRGGGGC